MDTKNEQTRNINLNNNEYNIRKIFVIKVMFISSLPKICSNIMVGKSNEQFVDRPVA